MKKGNTIRISINRNKYGLSQINNEHSSILLAKIIEIHKDKISVKAFDIFGNGVFKYITITKEEVLSVI